MGIRVAQITGPARTMAEAGGTIALVTIFPAVPYLHAAMRRMEREVDIEQIESVKGPSGNVSLRHAIWAEEIHDLVGKAECGNRVVNAKPEQPLRPN